MTFISFQAQKTQTAARLLYASGLSSILLRAEEND
jgi:hypothetical protein